MQEPAPVQAPATKAAEKPAALRENIFFRIGSAQIRTSEQAKVAALAEYLKANPSARIEIVGYADAATGSHALNLKLSRQRAAGVAAALEQAGIAADRISAEGRGDPSSLSPGSNRTVCAFASPNKQGGAVSLAAAVSCRRFFLPRISASASSFHGLRQCLAVRRACLSCVSFCRSRAFRSPLRRPFLGPVRRVSRLYFCRVFQPQAARR